MSALLGEFTDGPISVLTSEGVSMILRRAILANVLQPGQALRERDIAAELNISRTPVREALFTLNGEGLVELSPRRNARVRKVNAADIIHIYALRAVLECFAARCAAEAHSPAELQGIADALKEQKRLGSGGTAIQQARLDLAVHQAIARAAKSRLLETVLNQVLTVTATLRSRFKYDAARAKAVYQEHLAIYQAIAAGDGDLAEQLMRQHIEQSRGYAEQHPPTPA